MMLMLMLTAMMTTSMSIITAISLKLFDNENKEGGSCVYSEMIKESQINTITGRYRQNKMAKNKLLGTRRLTKGQQNQDGIKHPLLTRRPAQGSDPHHPRATLHRH
jgi:hypothetical protein